MTREWRVNSKIVSRLTVLFNSQSGKTRAWCIHLSLILDSGLVLSPDSELFHTVNYPRFNFVRRIHKLCTVAYSRFVQRGGAADTWRGTDSCDASEYLVAVDSLVKIIEWNGHLLIIRVLCASAIKAVLENRHVAAIDKQLLHRYLTN